jgi:cobalamin biosynthesis Mg chelatase CobN
MVGQQSPPAPDVEPPPRKAPPAVAVRSELPKSDITPPSTTAKFARGAKEARAAKAAKKSAKKAARQAERKARAKNNNKAAMRAMAASAKPRPIGQTSASARADGAKSARSSRPETGRRVSAPVSTAASQTTSRAASTTGVRTLGTTLLIVALVVLVLAGLGWFLASRH